jgi:Ras-like protein family member 11A
MRKSLDKHFSFDFQTFSAFFSETRYKYEAIVDNDTVMFEILDTCPARPADECCCSDVALCSPETAAWADGFVLVFSIIDRNSYLALTKARQQIKEARDSSAWPIPCVLIGSKADMVHLRQVSTHEGKAR